MIKSLQRPLKSFWHNSQTKALAYTQGIGAALLASVSTINSAVSNPSVKEYLDKLDLPWQLIVALAVLGVVTFIAHGHTD